MEREIDKYPNCLACQLNFGGGEVKPIGGVIWEGEKWRIEHAITPTGKWGIGTLILKTKRHIESFAELTSHEAEEFAQVLHKTAQIMQEELKPDRIFICSWGEQTRHLHFVLQPRYPGQHEAFADERDSELKGPLLQVKMMSLREPLPEKEVLEIVGKLRELLKKQ